MINVYIDPPTHSLLSNKLFRKSSSQYHLERMEFFVSLFVYLRKYCSDRKININTIDFWSESKKTPNDVYVSLEHKNSIRKMYWWFKNKNYSSLNISHFKKRILFGSEPPTVLPEVYKNLDNLFKVYDEVYLSCKVNNSRCHYFHIPQQPYKSIVSDYWNNFDRKFLVMINSNKSTRLYRRLIILMNRKHLNFQKDLLGERIKIIEFFSRTRDIDLYGVDWDKRLHFPYWLYTGAIQKVYKGLVGSKHQKLSEYTFAIALENSITPGFIGEALFDCFYVGTIPVYLGAPDVQEYIPKECFIDMRDFADYEELRTFLQSLNAPQIASYKEHARKFLESEQYKPFTNEHFAKTFFNAINN